MIITDGYQFIKENIVWNGTFHEYQTFEPLDYSNFENFINSADPKDEFETVAEYKKRIKNDIQKLFTAYLGKQILLLQYYPEQAFFDVELKSQNNLLNLKFHIRVPRGIAREFKAQTKSLDLEFSESLELKSISTEFQGKKFVGKSFFGKTDFRLMEQISEENNRLLKIIKWSDEFKLDLPKNLSELKKLTKINAGAKEIQSYSSKYPDLISKNITYIPKEIDVLSNLTKLNLFGNQIKKIPKEIANLKNLTELNLQCNQMEDIMFDDSIRKALPNCRILG